MKIVARKSLIENNNFVVKTRSQSLVDAMGSGLGAVVAALHHGAVPGHLVLTPGRPLRGGLEHVCCIEEINIIRDLARSLVEQMKVICLHGSVDRLDVWLLCQ